MTNFDFEIGRFSLVIAQVVENPTTEICLTDNA